MQNEQEFSKEEGFAIIQSMINKVRNRYSEDGHLYLLWGWVVLACSVAQFILMHYFHYSRGYMVWWACWLAFIYQTVYFYKVRGRKSVRTYTDEIIKYVWIVFLINIILGGIVLGIKMGETQHNFINVFYLISYAVPIFLCGIIIRFRPLIIGGICCWLLSVMSLFISEEYQVLMISAAMIFAWIIPGYLLKKRFKKSTE